MTTNTDQKSATKPRKSPREYLLSLSINKRKSTLEQIYGKYRILHQVFVFLIPPNLT